MRILIVEDERRLAEALGQIMAEQRYQADVVFDGADGLDYALTGQYDAIVLDVMLPKVDGFEVARRLRCAHVSTPILMLTARDEIPDKIAGLDHGADDYMTKPFAIGVRIEHAQATLSEAQFGPAWERLPAADYKLACHLPTGRSAFTFCVCPGGQVVAAASEEGRLVTNGMSCRARDGANINGGFLVGVSPADFGSEHPLAGVEFQRRWEAAAYTLGGGGFRAPAQTVADFLARRPSTALGRIVPTYRPGVTPAELDRCLPGYVADTLRGALPLFDRKLRGFAAPEAVLTGVESRSSSPVRILRGEDFQSPIRGLYPCGEGAGYAGGITSAAMDGIRVAEAIASK